MGRTAKGSFVDKVLKEMKEKDGWDKSHSNEHVVEVVYR